jgi:hypothetical protein
MVDIEELADNGDLELEQVRPPLDDMRRKELNKR